MDILWNGRMKGAIDQGAAGFNASISFDARLCRQDITGSIAHARMLGATGIIPQTDAQSIVAGLQELLAAAENGTLDIDFSCEDIHTFIERELTQKIGDAGKMLHTARSRNDQVALDLRLYLRDETADISGLLAELIETLATAAETHADAVMPGYTHLQRAQPVTMGHHLLAYAAMLLRDLERLRDAEKRLLTLPLGAGALAGTTYPIDRQMVCRELGFRAVGFNSIDSVSDRDFVVETTFIISLIMAHLSRLCEELIAWCSWEFRFVEMPDAYSTGSSIMPQKKNPDIAELTRGKTGRVYGDLMALLTLIKGLPLAYNKDMQEDKEALFDAVDTVKACLPLAAGMIADLKVNRDALRGAASAGFINATDCADYLVTKGLPFRDAYRVTGQLVNYAIARGETLETLPLEVYQTFNSLFEADVFAAVDLDTCVGRRQSEGGTAPESVRHQIKQVRGLLKTLAPQGETVEEL